VAAEAEAENAPLRAELFSIGQLQRHAQQLAERHEIGRHAGSDRLLPRLDDNERVLVDAYALVTEAVTRGRQLTPAAEWFVDNYHLIEDQIRTARRHLPRGYSRELPRIVNGPSGTPRVYTIALELISHAHGRVDLEALRAYISAYQQVQPLRLGELWAIPIMLRLALIENLRRVIAGVTAGRVERERAGGWAERLLDIGTSDPSRVVRVLADMIDEDPPLTNAFVSELASRLRGQGSEMVFPMAWLEQRLVESGKTLEHVFQLASQSQAADQVAIGNSIGSLRFLGATDWREFVESASVVDHALRVDAVYPTMDFATRDRYRHQVEAIARQSPTPELGVATTAIALAAAAGHPKRAHVGYFLVGDGRRQLEAATGMRRSVRQVVRAIAIRGRLPIYVGAIAAITTALTLVVGMPGVAMNVLTALCASQLATAIVQWAATQLVAPRVLPRLDFSSGIPLEHRTIVVIPTMLTSIESIDDLVAALEVRFLANRDQNLAFALVTDLRDAPTETLPQDALLVAHARGMIEALAERYATHPGGGFYLFHRARRLNPGEGVWMGWERKRGKLEDFTATLRGEQGRFALVVGTVDRLADFQYVIVLDSDTELPRDAARELAATLGHPLNRPVWDATRRTITDGYAILQPRVAISLTSAIGSPFARLMAGDCGIDPYTRAVSAVYQDVFEEGSFIGKGIYDVDAVHRVLTRRFPDNRILSHDLLEGAYVRSALVSDVALLEDYPLAFTADASRRARWIRGDWQILGWLIGRVPTLTGRERNPISVLSRWKIFDNLRRSILPPATAHSRAAPSTRAAEPAHAWPA
jgi:hypothetical protein